MIIAQLQAGDAPFQRAPHFPQPGGGAVHRPTAGAPPQFGGSDDVWSPEHLLVAAALLCLKTTFDAHARHNKLAVYAWRGDGSAELVKGPQGPVFTSIELAVEVVTDAGAEERVQQILEKAEKQCIVSRALNVPVHMKASVTALATRAA